jgi:hypothetical protein
MRRCFEPQPATINRSVDHALLDGADGARRPGLSATNAALRCRPGNFYCPSGKPASLLTTAGKTTQTGVALRSDRRRYAFEQSSSSRLLHRRCSSTPRTVPAHRHATIRPSRIAAVHVHAAGPWDLPTLRQTGLIGVIAAAQKRVARISKTASAQRASGSARGVPLQRHGSSDGALVARSCFKPSGSDDPIEALAFHEGRQASAVRPDAPEGHAVPGARKARVVKLARAERLAHQGGHFLTSRRGPARLGRALQGDEIGVWTA